MNAFTLIALAGLLTLPAAHAKRSVERSLPAAHNVTVDIDNVCGGVEVVAWDRPEVKVTGLLDNDEDDLVVKGSPARIEIEVTNPDHDELECAQLKIQLPPGARLEIETISSDLEVAGLTGTVDLETVSGDVNAHGDPSQLEIETVSGNVNVFAATPSLAIETVSGDVTVHKARGRLEAETVSGEIDVKGGPFARVEVSTVSGDVVLQGSLEASARVELDTHSGDVRVLLPPLEHVAYALSSFSGDIEGFLSDRKVSGFGPGTTVALLKGDGTTGITVSTHSGDIDIQQTQP